MEIIRVTLFTRWTHYWGDHETRFN